MGTVVATWRSAPRPAGASMLVGPDGTAVGSVSGGCVEGAVYEEAKDVVETGEPTLERYGVSDDDAFAVGPDLRRDPRRLRRVGLPRVVPGARRGRRVGRQPRAGRRRHRGEGPRRPASAGGWCSGRTASRARSACSAWTTPSPPTPAGMLAAGRTGLLHVGHDGERRGDDLTLFVNSFAPAGPDGRVRRDRLRRRRRPGGRVPRLPGHRLRRPAGVRDAEALPRGARGDRRVAAPVPAGRGRRRPHRRAHGALRAHPRPEVRRPAAGGRAADPGGLRRRDGVAAHARGAARRGCARRG